MKTLDKKNVYKVADISQLVICSNKKPEPSEPEKDKPPPQPERHAQDGAPGKKEKAYQYPHGLVPPLKNVRKRRFRKTKKKKFMDAPEIERELKRLLR